MRFSKSAYNQDHNLLVGAELTLVQEKIVVWYDGPLAFIAKDRNGQEMLMIRSDDVMGHTRREEYEVYMPPPTVHELCHVPMNQWAGVRGNMFFLTVVHRHRDSSKVEYDMVVTEAEMVTDVPELYRQDEFFVRPDDLTLMDGEGDGYCDFSRG